MRTISNTENLKIFFDSNQLLQRASEFAGVLWTHIQQFPTYAQDVRVAYPSVVVMTLISFKVAKIATYCFKSIFPSTEERLEDGLKLIDVTSGLIGYSIMLLTPAFFAKKVQLPIPWYATIAVILATVGCCVLLEKK